MLMMDIYALMIFYLGVVSVSNRSNKLTTVGKRVYSLLRLYLGIGRSLYRLKDSYVSSIGERVEMLSRYGLKSRESTQSKYRG
jgi:hypothetical protein